MDYKKMNDLETVDLSQYCEKVIMKYFPSVQIQNQLGGKRMYNFAGIVSADGIRGKGGLYECFIAVCALNYNSFNRMEKIDEFLDINFDIREKELCEIGQEKVNDILNSLRICLEE